MNKYFGIVFLILLNTITSCGGRTVSDKKKDSESKGSDSLKSNEYNPICKYSDSNYEFEFKGIECGENSITSDTIFITVGEYGGEVQGTYIKVIRPKLDNSYYMLQRHQNRLATSNMGPDVVLDNWFLYNSPFDTLRFDPSNQSFFIDTIPASEQNKFVKYTEDEFFLAYYRAAESGYVSQDTLDNPPKSEINKYKKNRDHILDLTSPELHRIILVLKHGNKTEKVMVFTYGHVG